MEHYGTNQTDSLFHHSELGELLDQMLREASHQNKTKRKVELEHLFNQTSFDQLNDSYLI